MAAGETEVYVAEVSSYQLASTRDFAPNAAVVLNITPEANSTSLTTSAAAAWALP